MAPGLGQGPTWYTTAPLRWDPPQGHWTPQIEGSRPPGQLIHPHEDSDTGQPRYPVVPTFDPSHWSDRLAFELKSKSHSCILVLFKIHLTEFLVRARPCPMCYR